MDPLHLDQTAQNKIDSGKVEKALYLYIVKIQCDMTETRPYHHGELRAALIDAGAGLLNDVGWSGLTLRACAARAGVSHAAPAYHFGSLVGLRTALASEAFRQFHQTILEHTDRAAPTRAERLRAAGQGYIAFARANPGLFHLMFGPAELDHGDDTLNEARRAAYEQLGENVSAYLSETGSAETDRQLRLSVWSMVHGYALLHLSGQLEKPGMAGTEEALLDDMLAVAEQYASR